uniref:Uncharacterized protein n=1 Tax=Helicotheca tamesis TaxID=374047 RepID=A0A7S2H4U0_9STRA
MSNTQGEHSIDTVACPATQALDMMNKDATSFLPRNSLALADRVTDKLSMEINAFHLSEAEGSASPITPSTSKCPLESSFNSFGISTLVSPSPSHASLQKCRFSGPLSSSMDSFDLSSLARATEPVETSVAFPVIEWTSDDEEETFGDNTDNTEDDKSFLASRPLAQCGAPFGDDDDDEDDESAPVLFRPGTSSGMRKRCSDDMSSGSSGMQRTKSRRSCLNLLSADDHASMPCSSPLFGNVSHQEDTRSHSLPSSYAAPSHGCSGWGQFIQPGTGDDASVPVLFAVTLTSTANNRRSCQKPSRRVSRSYRPS